MSVLSQEKRQEERENLKSIIELKFGSIRRFCDVTGEIHYSSFRNMLLRNPISDWQLDFIRRAKLIALSTNNKKLEDEIKASDLETINRTIKEQGISQSKLSKEIGVARTTMRDLLEGRVKKKNDLYSKLTAYLQIED